MKEFTIKITDTEVYINGKLQHFAYPMDKESKEDDLNKKAFVALANEMNYEAPFLFEEMADRLDEILDEIDEDSDEDDDFLQGLMDEAAMEETINIWFDQLLESTGKSDVSELSAEELRAEIEEMKGTIRNEEILLGVSEFAKGNIEQMKGYLEKLEELLKKKEE